MQQQQSGEIQAIRGQFQKMISQAPETQKESIREIKNFVIDTLKKLENILKKKTDTNQDFCITIVGSAIKIFTGSIINTYTLVAENPKVSKKFITMVSKLSLKKMKKPFEKLEKEKEKISKMTEEKCEIYAEKVASSLAKYLTKKGLQMNALTV
jgi:hypothetical protein